MYEYDLETEKENRSCVVTPVQSAASHHLRTGAFCRTTSNVVMPFTKDS